MVYRSGAGTVLVAADDARTVEGAGTILRHHGVVLDVAARTVRVGGREVPVTVQQFELLRALCEARGAALHRSQLVARIAAAGGEPPSDRAIDLHISRLRRRLGSSGVGLIEAVHGIGYRLASAHDALELPPDAAGAVLDSIEEGVIVVDETMRIRAANRAAMRLLGRDDLVGLACEEVMDCRTSDGDGFAGPACLGRAVSAGGGALIGRRVMVAADGSHAAVDLSHTAVPLDGGPRLVAIEIRRGG